MTITKLTGLIAAPHTPMKPDGSVNLDAIDRQADLLSAAGLRGVFVCGTTGEGLSLTAEERMAVAERWVAVAPRQLAVIVQVGGEPLAQCRALAAHAQKIAAHAIGAMPPCFFKPARLEDLVAFCGEIASAAPDLPFYYYHIPSLTGVDFAVLDFLRVGGTRIATLAGAKLTYENLMDYGRCLALDGGRYNMLFGRDEILLSALVLGARGAVGTTYNYAAPLYHRLMAAFEKGDLAEARAWQLRSVEMIDAMIRHGGVPAGKAMMKLIGLDCGPCRLPLRTLSDEQCRSLRADLERVGFFEFCLKP
jgi:N-acetylneuraminate lyase